MSPFPGVSWLIAGRKSNCLQVFSWNDGNVGSVSSRSGTCW
jgi:hypothetical protein